MERIPRVVMAVQPVRTRKGRVLSSRRQGSVSRHTFTLNFVRRTALPNRGAFDISINSHHFRYCIYAHVGNDRVIGLHEFFYCVPFCTLVNVGGRVWKRAPHVMIIKRMPRYTFQLPVGLGSPPGPPKNRSILFLTRPSNQREAPVFCLAQSFPPKRTRPRQRRQPQR